jgi:hypothetical protein
MPRRRGLALLLFTSTLLIAACGYGPPEKEIQQAQEAIVAARAAGADDYAHDELAAAEKALANARDAVSERDYRQALSNAVDSRERAQTAMTDAAAQKALTRAETERMLRATTAALAQAKARPKTTETSRGSSPALASLRLAIDAADRAVQEARTAFDRSDYLAAKRTLDAANARLAAATRDLEPPSASPSRRRR